MQTNVPHLPDLDAVRRWISMNPFPDPRSDMEAAEKWLLRYWRMDELVDERPYGEAPAFVDWVEMMAADRNHPVSEAARSFLDWQQPAFDFGL